MWKKSGALAACFGERYEEVILPFRHAGILRGLQRASAEEERRRHDVELDADFA